MLDFEGDMAVFFDTDEFAATASVKIGDDEPFDVAGIFDTRPPFTATNFKGFRGTDNFGGDGITNIAGAQPRFLGPTSLLVGAKTGRATLTLMTCPGDPSYIGKEFVVHTNQADGTGMSLLTLKVA